MDGKPVTLKDGEYYLDHPDELMEHIDQVLGFHERQLQASYKQLIEDIKIFLDYLNQLVEEEE